MRSADMHLRALIVYVARGNNVSKPIVQESPLVKASQVFLQINV